MAVTLSKLASFAVVQTLGLVVPKFSAYAVLTAPSSVSKMAAFALIGGNEVPTTNVSKFSSYVLLDATAVMISKIECFAVLQTSQLLSASKFSSFAVIQDVPASISKLLSFAVLQSVPDTPPSSSQNVQPSALVPVESLATQDALWSLPCLLVHNWTSDMKVSTSWDTEIIAAQSAGETRTGKLTRPYRKLDYSVLAHNQSQIALLRSWRTRLGIARSLVPLYSDQSELTSAYSGGTSLACNARYRRFFPGARIVVLKANSFPAVPEFEMTTISSVALDSLNIAALSGSFPSGSLVMPLIESDLILTNESDLITGTVQQASLTALETVGRSTLLALPDGTWSTYQGLPIFPCPVQWDKITSSFTRTGEQSRQGIGNHYVTYGSRPWEKIQIDVLCTSRAEAWDVLQFFDGRRGRLRPFFILSPSDDYLAISDSGFIVKVRAAGPLVDWAFRPYIGFVTATGEQVVRQIQSVTRSGTEDTLTLLDAFSMSLSNIRRVCVAYKARWASDEIEEPWLSSEAIKFSLAAIEIADTTIDISNIADPRTPITSPATDFA